MSTVTVTGWVFMVLEYAKAPDGTCDYSVPKVWAPELWSCKVSEDDDRVFIGKQKFDCLIPDDFNPIPAQVAALHARKAAALADYQRTVAEINDRLSKLLALTNEVAA